MRHATRLSVLLAPVLLMACSTTHGASGAPSDGPASAPSAIAPVWDAARCETILDKTLTVRLDPDLSALGPGEQTAVRDLLSVGGIMQRLYEESRHPQAAAARAALGRMEGPEAEPLRTLYRLFQGPIATTPENAREPFLSVAPETPGKNVYPWGIGREEVSAFVAAHPEARDAILGERTAVRRATAESLRRDLAALARHPVVAGLHPGLKARLEALLAAPDPKVLYAVPYAVAWADELVDAQRLLFHAADAVTAEDPELARYLRNRGRDLLSSDYESGDAAWVTGRFGHLNAQIGAYETYDDALFGVKAFHSLSLLLRDEAATAALEKGLAGLQDVEDALPYEGHKTVRSDLPVGVYRVVADFGQARGTNTATILPNDALFARRYGRTILLRENIMKNPELFAVTERIWKAAVVPELAGDLSAEGDFQRTLWHEVGHYLGVDRTKDGRTLDQALEGWSDSLEEMKSDLVSLFALSRFHAAGTVDDALWRAVQADGVLRTLQTVRPRPDQPYQTMELTQFNYFLEHGLMSMGEDGRLAIHPERYDAVVTALLKEVLTIQRAGDPAKAEAFFRRWTAWTDDLHGALAARLRAAQGPRYRLVRYGALGE